MRRFAALLLVALAAPLSAADPIWALQQAIADRVSALEDQCECDPCECPGCPHSKAIGEKLYQPRDDGKPALLRPHLTATIWSSGCIHGERWLSEAYPELIAKGWRVDVRRVSPDSGVACPTFEFRDRTWNGYTGKAAHFAKLVTAPVHYERGIALAPGETLVAIDGVPVERQEAQPQYMSRSVPPARRQWNYYGSGSLADHLRRTHGIDPSNMSSQDMRNAHSHAHEGTWPQVRQRACPLGGC